MQPATRGWCGWSPRKHGQQDAQSAQLISQSHELDPATSGEPSKPRLSGAVCERSQLGAGQSSRCSLCRTCGAWAELAGDRQPRKLLRLSLLCCSWSRQHKMRHCRSRKAKSNSCEGSFRLQKAMHRQTFNPFARWPCLRNPLRRVFPGPVQFCSPLLRGHRGKLFARDRDFRPKFRAHSGPGPCILGSAFPRLQARARADPLLPTWTDEVGPRQQLEKCLHETARKRS